MGIRFLCPSGHKLNVKSFLAGKRGICPHCGAKFEIPFESVASAPPPPAATSASAASGDHGTVKAAPGAKTTRPSYTAPSKPIPRAPLSPATLGIERSLADKSAPSGPAGNPSATSTPAAAVPVTPTVLPIAPASNAISAAPDPIAEAPSAVWYVRTNTGGQFGPARGEMIRQWLGERRIGPDYLVWREGWPEWKRASAVFAALAAPGAVGPSGPNVATPTAGAPQMEDDWVDAIIESQTHPTFHKPRPRSSRNNNLLLAISFVVVLLGVILVVVVIIAANKQMGGREPPADSPPSSTSTTWLLRSNSRLAGLISPPGLECDATRNPGQIGDNS
jgi:GYF domain 2